MKKNNNKLSVATEKPHKYNTAEVLSSVAELGKKMGEGDSNNIQLHNAARAYYKADNGNIIFCEPAFLQEIINNAGEITGSNGRTLFVQVGPLDQSPTCISEEVDNVVICLVLSTSEDMRHYRGLIEAFRAEIGKEFSNIKPQVMMLVNPVSDFNTDKAMFLIQLLEPQTVLIPDQPGYSTTRETSGLISNIGLLVEALVFSEFTVVSTSKDVAHTKCLFARIDNAIKEAASQVAV